MPALEIESGGQEPQEETMSNKPIVGIIYPPPEVRNIVDKTASFVARNGPEFESRIRQNEISNTKFNFLIPGDPYHAYYQHKVKEFKEGRGGAEPVAPALKPQTHLPSRIHDAVSKQQEMEIKDPPAEFEFVADPPSISAFDLDIVKLTAQFVARNGRTFLTNLMNNESRNYQFDFLRPAHSLFNYFTKLVEQYTKVLIPPKDLKPKLAKEALTAKHVSKDVQYRVLWARHVEAQKRKEEEDLERERVAYASIDWHDFVTVEMVDFQPGETGNFPPPTTPDEVGARVIAQERYKETGGKGQGDADEMDVASDEEEEEGESDADSEGPVEHIQVEKPPGKETNTQIQDMEQESSEEEEEDFPAPPLRSAPAPPPPKEPVPPPQPPLPNPALVRKDYNPKAPKLDAAPLVGEQYLISPITGEKIPAHKMQDHIRIGLLQEQKQKARELQEEVFPGGSAIETTLKKMAERRTDIFGVGGEETQIGKKIGEEDIKQDEKVTWDGHTASMESTSRAARAHITIEEQIAAIHKIKGLVPDEEKEKIGPSEVPRGQQHVKPLPRPPSPPAMPAVPPQPPKPPQPAPPVPHQPPGMSLPPPPPAPLRHPPMPPNPPMATRPPMVMMAPQPGGGPPMMAVPQMRPQPSMGMPQGMGFVPMPPRPQPVPPSRPPPPPQQATRRPPPTSEDEPSSKKARTEESLIPENEWLAKNPPSVSFSVAIPNIPDKPEWKLNGQLLTFSMPLTDTVSVIKAKIHEVTGMPAGKQKLQMDTLFIKDSNSLAFYNFAPGSRVQLQVKERGGRKK